MAALASRHHLALRLALPVALALLLCLAFAPRAFADAAPSVTYDGASRQLTVQGASGSATATDLFPAFKDLMPGDQRQQDVQLAVQGATSQVRLYVQAVVDDKTAQALQPVTLAASASNNTALSDLQTASAGKVFASKTLVATFAGSGTAVLHLQLCVPTSVSNELANANEQVSWEFTAEDDSGQIPIVQPDNAPENQTGAGVFSKLTQTGDAVGYAVLAALAAAAIVLAVAAKRRVRK